MSEEWLGCTVSIELEEPLGSFQGQVDFVDPNGQTIVLKTPFCNGTAWHRPTVTINACDVVKIDILEQAASHEESGQSTVPIVRKRLGRTTSESGASRNMQSPKKAIPENMRTPNKKERQRMKWSEKDEACFGAPIQQIMNHEFDFEKNLALFDKKAVFQEILASQKPDIVRQTIQKYRHDENVLTSAPAVFRQIDVPEAEAQEYVTDTGLVVPCITAEVRARLFTVAERSGLTRERQIETTGHAATEMILQLLGGSHRLNPNNSHQCPTVVVLCGLHHQGAMGICCARLLATHAVNVVLFLPDTVGMPSDIASELALYRMTGQRVATATNDLPSASVDIIVAALDDQELGQQISRQPWYRAAVTWANNMRASVLAIDPPAGISELNTKFALVPALPLAYAPNNGKIYLFNFGIPRQVFEKVGINYLPPFGPKFVIPLYVNEEHHE